MSAEELLKLDLLADAVEIERLKDMKVLLPVETYDCKGQTPKRLTTRMVRAWRDKHNPRRTCVAAKISVRCSRICLAFTRLPGPLFSSKFSPHSQTFSNSIYEV